MGYNLSYKWINPTYPIYNWGYNPFTKWDEPPSSFYIPMILGEISFVVGEISILSLYSREITMKSPSSPMKKPMLVGSILQCEAPQL